MIKIVIPGKPMSKSNSKAINKYGKSYIPSEYKEYEDKVKMACRKAYKGEPIDEKCIMILKLYFADKRNRDAHNYPKSICDGIEKSGLISNDKLFKPVYIKEYRVDSNPRAEVEIYKQSEYDYKFKLKPLKDKSCYTPITVPGNPVSKSNFKLNKNGGKAWMPTKGKYRKYNDYEMQVAWECMQAHKANPIDVESILVLDLYFNQNRTRDIHNYPKSICDGIEKGGVITNDSLFKEIVIREFVDKENPRAEIAILPKTDFKLEYTIKEKEKVKI